MKNELDTLLREPRNSIPTILNDLGYPNQISSRGGVIRDMRVGHEEKTPSFSISCNADGIWLWHRFGADGAGGNAYGLLLELGYTKRMAMDFLRNRAGILASYVRSATIPTRDSSTKISEKITNRLRTAQDLLARTEVLPELFVTHGLSKNVCQQFGLGLEPDGSLLIPLYRGKNLVQIKRRNQTGTQKYSYLVTGGGAPAWIFDECKNPEFILVVEGELNAVGVAWVLRESRVVIQGVAGANNSPEKLQITNTTPVYIYTDADEAGNSAKTRWGKQFSDWGFINVCQMPSTPDNSDFCELLARDEIKLRNWIMNAISEATATIAHQNSSPSAKKPRSVDQILDLIRPKIDLFHNGNDEAYADLHRDGHRETFAIRSKMFRQFVVKTTHVTLGIVPTANALNDVLLALESFAIFDGDSRRVFVRIGYVNDDRLKIFLDLGTANWEILQIDADGWALTTECPIRFARPSSLQPLPLPVVGGNLRALLTAINLPDELYPLVTGWLLGCFMPQKPFPILEFIGEQGTAKTTLARLLKSLIDPHRGGIRSAPNNESDLLVSARNNHILTMDNVSHIPSSLSDALCRLSTGGGIGKRTLFTDADETVLEAMRPLILTGITNVILRSDLSERSIIIELPVIPPSSRRTIEAIDRDFTILHPALLGALLTAVSTAIKNYSTVTIKNLPRMADFAIWVTAGESALGLQPGEFLTAYIENNAVKNDEILENPIIQCILKLLETRVEWSGTATQLLNVMDQIRAKLFENHSRTDLRFPSSPESLAKNLKRLMPNLRAIGIEITKLRDGKSRMRTIVITKSVSQPSELSAK